MSDNKIAKSHNDDPNKEFANAIIDAAAEPLKDIAGQFFPTKEERQSDREYRNGLLEFEKERFNKTHSEDSKNNDFFRKVAGFGLTFAALTGVTLIAFDKDCAGLGILATALGTGLGFLAGRK